MPTPEEELARQAQARRNLVTIYAMATLPAAGVGASLAWGTKHSPWVGAAAGAFGAFWAVSLIRGLST